MRLHEPPLDDRFDAFKNVVLTPHAAGSTEEAQQATAVMLVESVLQADAGEPPVGFINPEVWEHRRRD